MNEQLVPSAQPEPASQPPEGDAAAAGEEQLTVEQVEALWANRMQQRDKAHNAAEAVLQEQIDSLKRQLGASPQTPGQPTDDAEKVELRRKLEASEQGRIVDARRAKYPFVAAMFPADDPMFLGSEAGLAKLNSRLEDAEDHPARMAPTSPRRATPAAGKTIDQKSKEELLDDLKTVAPAYQQWLRTTQG